LSQFTLPRFRLREIRFHMSNPRFFWKRRLLKRHKHGFVAGVLMTIRREPSEGQYACKGISANQAMRLKEHRDRARDEIVVGFETRRRWQRDRTCWRLWQRRTPPSTALAFYCLDERAGIDCHSGTVGCHSIGCLEFNYGFHSSMPCGPSCCSNPVFPPLLHKIESILSKCESQIRGWPIASLETQMHPAVPGMRDPYRLPDP